MYAHGDAAFMGKYAMSNGLSYVLRLLKGESPKSVLESMPEEDYAKFKSATANLGKTGLNRQQRRKMERNLKTVRR